MWNLKTRRHECTTLYMYYTLQLKKCITFIVSLKIYFSLKKLNHLLLLYRWENWGTQRPKLPLSIMSSFVSALIIAASRASPGKNCHPKTYPSFLGLRSKEQLSSWSYWWSHCHATEENWNHYRSVVHFPQDWMWALLLLYKFCSKLGKLGLAQLVS